MKKLLLISMICVFAWPVLAVTNYHCFATFDTHELIRDYKNTSTNTPVLYTLEKLNAQDWTQIYLCVLTEQQYQDGWANLAQAIKDAAQAAAEDESKDYEDWSTQEQAIIDAIYEDINTLRTNAVINLPELSKQDIKKRIKDNKKKPKKDKK